jgi:hypothetical protein
LARCEGQLAAPESGWKAGEFEVPQQNARDEATVNSTEFLLEGQFLACLEGDHTELTDAAFLRAVRAISCCSDSKADVDHALLNRII